MIQEFFITVLVFLFFVFLMCFRSVDAQVLPSGAFPISYPASVSGAPVVYAAPPISTTYSVVDITPSAFQTAQGFQATVRNGLPLIERSLTVAAPAMTTGTLAPSVLASAANTGVVTGALANSATFATEIAMTPAIEAKLVQTAVVAGSVGQFVPGIGTLLKAANLGYMGYELYKALSAQSISVDSSGSPLLSSAISYCLPNLGCLPYSSSWIGTMPSNYCKCVSTTDTAATFSNINGGACNLGVQPFTVAQSTSTPTSTQLSSAVTAAITASPQAAADLANIAFYALPTPIPLSSLPIQSADVTNPPPVTVGSPWNVISTTTDNLGNVTQDLSRNVAVFNPAPASVPPAPPVASPSVEKTTVVNGTPTSSTTTPGAPLIPGVSGGVSGASDLCLAHPEILACADLTKLGDVPTPTLLDKTIDLGTLTPVSIGSPAMCPPPLVLPGMFGSPPMVLDIWKWPCEFSSLIKAVNIAAAALFSIFLVMGEFKRG